MLLVCLFGILPPLLAPGQLLAPEQGKELIQVTPLFAGAMIIFLIAGICYTWMAFVTCIKRLHDRDNSGWWILLGFVPIVGMVWYIVVICCLPGTVGENRFGADPTVH